MAPAGGYIPPADNRMPAADSRHNLPQPVNCMNRTVATNGRKCSRTTKASTSILRKSRTEPVFGFETSFHLRLAGENLFRLPVLCFTITMEVSPVGSFTLSQSSIKHCSLTEYSETSHLRRFHAEGCTTCFFHPPAIGFLYFLSPQFPYLQENAVKLHRLIIASTSEDHAHSN